MRCWRRVVAIDAVDALCREPGRFKASRLSEDTRTATCLSLRRRAYRVPLCGWMQGYGIMAGNSTSLRNMPSAGSKVPEINCFMGFMGQSFVTEDLVMVQATKGLDATLVNLSG